MTRQPVLERNARIRAGQGEQSPGELAEPPLLEDRQRYSVAARRSILERSWPAICDELLGHYEAVLSPNAHMRMARRRYAQGE